MHKALAEARRQLGPEATVLHTRQLREPTWFGLGRKQNVEIVAAVDTQPVTAGLPVVGVAEPPASFGDIRRVARDLEEIRSIVAAIRSGGAPSAQPARFPAADTLVRHGVPDRIAELLVQDGRPAPAQIKGAIARILRCAGALTLGRGQSRVAVVGPTGVGKTTTIAKLAAEYSLRQGKRVALLTLDTYRIGAREQLAGYARIMGVPLEVALSIEDVDALIAAHTDKDSILIDTVGRSQRKQNQIEELERFLRAADPTEVHLAVSASASPVAQREAVDSFACMAPRRLILTKLDECPQPGCILGLAAQTLLPLSYVTCGQDVPDDIRVADPVELAGLIWEGAP